MVLVYFSLSLWVLSFFFTISAAQETATVVSAPQDCCALLSNNLSSATFLPGSTQYAATSNAYWSIQARLTPTCVFRPPSSEDLANAVEELATNSCQFAIKGGGYTAWAGAASVQDGVTIDLGEISNVQLSKDKNVAFVGAGASWSNVYNFLGSQGVAVPAGRSMSSGVGGLILGGGNGFFSAQYGFTCDNVANYVVILANGTIVNVNAQVEPDLYGVLKGGSNNFGIVVRFDIKIFQQGDLWGGLVTYPNSTSPEQVTALAAFTDNIVNDPKGSVVSTWTYNSASAQTNVINSYAYTQAIDSPAVFQNFNIEPVLADTRRISSLRGLAEELQGTNNTRNLMATLTFANDAALMSQVVDLSNLAVQNVKDTQGLVWSFHLQPLPRVVTEQSIANGGNMLGLDRTQGNLIVFILEINWSNSQDDSAITNAANALLVQIAAYTKIVGKDNDFIYLNYALDNQNPFRGYGAANLEKMRSVSKRYDPEGLWQKLVKGGFKLG